MKWLGGFIVRDGDYHIEDQLQAEEQGLESPRDARPNNTSS